MPGFIRTKSASSIRVKLQSEWKSNWSVQLIYRADSTAGAHTHTQSVLLVWMNLKIIQETKEDLLYEEMSISSGSSPMFTSKRSWTSLSVRASPSSDTNVMARPFVPNLPARATYTNTHQCSWPLYQPTLHSSGITVPIPQYKTMSYGFDRSPLHVFLSSFWYRLMLVLSQSIWPAFSILNPCLSYEVLV